MTHQFVDEKSPAPRFRRGVLTVMAAIPVVVIPALEWLPWIAERLRPWFILPSLAIAALGLFLLRRDEEDVHELLAENRMLKSGIRKAQPEYLLREISSTLFTEGAWRLTVYKKEYSTEVGDHLTWLASVASDGDQRNLGAHRILIKPATMFEFSFRANLADPNFRQPVESGHSPEDVHSANWKAWRDEIFGAGAVIADRSTFRARKYAWYAAQDPDAQSVFCAIAESANPEGIAVDHLDHSFTPAWLFFVSRVAELQDVAAVGAESSAAPLGHARTGRIVT